MNRHYMTTFSILDYGAIGDGETDNAEAIQRAIDACSGSGGGRVLVPAGGRFVTGPFKFRSHVELHVQPNATLMASTDESLYTELAFCNNSEGSIWIGGREAHNVAITGTIDGRGREFMVSEKPTHYNYKIKKRRH
jgi:polygalacturonase